MAAEHFTRAEEIFTPEVVKRLAEIGQFQPSANLNTFREMLCLAAGYYFEEINAPDSNKIAREVTDLFGGKLNLEEVTETTRHYIKQRAERLGKAWPQAPEDIQNLAAFGRICAPDTKREKTRRTTIIRPVLFAPTPTRHPKKRVASTVFTAQLKAAYEHANNKPAPKTATTRQSTQSGDDLIGPFPKLVREVFRLCGTPEVNVRKALDRARLLMKKRTPLPEM
jgi:hypothetical protein